MKRVILPRRRALALAGGAFAAPMIASGIARADADWPSKPVRYINLFPAGGPTDIDAKSNTVVYMGFASIKAGGKVTLEGCVGKDCSGGQFTAVLKVG